MLGDACRAGLRVLLWPRALRRPVGIDADPVWVIAGRLRPHPPVAEAGDEEQIWRCVALFGQAGSVEVLPASACEAVINRGGCAQVPA